MKKSGEAKLRKTYKVAFVPDEKAGNQIKFLSHAMILLWNMACDEAERWIEKKEKAITAFSFNIWLTKVRQITRIIDEEQIDFGAISVDVSREVLRKLAGSYQSFFNLKKNNDFRAKKPRPKNPDWFQTLSWSSFSIKENKLFLPGYNGDRIEISIPDYLKEKIVGKKVVHVTIACNKRREFELNLIVASPLPEKIADPKFFRAIDLGAGDIAVTDSDGSEFLIPSRRPDKYWMDEIRKIEGRLKKRTKGSRGSERLAKARRTIHNYAENQRISYQRKLAHALLEEKVECVVVGKPKTRLGLSRTEKGTPDQHFGSQNTGYLFRLLIFIKEKAQERGVEVIELSDPTRKGEVDNPESKFYASRDILVKTLHKRNLPIPFQFARKHFDFKQ